MPDTTLNYGTDHPQKTNEFQEFWLNFVNFFPIDMLHVYPSIKLPTRPSQLPWDHFYPIYTENYVFR